MASPPPRSSAAGPKYSKLDKIIRHIARVEVDHAFSWIGRIEEFQKKLEEVRLEAHLEHAVIQECVKVQNKIGLNLNFYEKFSKLWEGLGIRDRYVGQFHAHLVV